jgi:hypothetical protein
MCVKHMSTTSVSSNTLEMASGGVFIAPTKETSHCSSRQKICLYRLNRSIHFSYCTMEMMDTWGCLIFCQKGNYRFVDKPTQAMASDQQDLSPQSKNHIASWLSTVRCSVDLATKANTFMWIKKHKQEQEIPQESWGITNRWWRNCSWQINLSKTQPLARAEATNGLQNVIRLQGVQVPCAHP